MAIFYPFPNTIPAWQIILATIAIAAISIAALLFIRRASYLIIGWLWYLGTMFPLIGIWQHGRWPEMADRWVYVPAIGLFVILAWGASDLFKRFRIPRAAAASAAGLIIACLMLVTINQVAFWQNSRTIFAHTLAVTEDNWMAHYNYGHAMKEAGNLEQAVIHYKKALALKPGRPEIHNNLGTALGRMGRLEQAIYHFKQAIYHSKTENFLVYYRADSFSIQDRAAALYNLANAYALKGKKSKALEYLKKARSLEPNCPQAANIRALISRLQTSGTKNK